MKNTKLTLEWSFKPILIWMRLIGVPLNWRKETRLTFSLQTAFNHSLFFLNLTISLIVGIHTIIFVMSSGDSIRKLSVTFTWVWNFSISKLNQAAVNIGSHFILLAYTVLKWPYLFENFNQFESITHGDIFLNFLDYQKIRFTFYAAFFVILSVYI